MLSIEKRICRLEGEREQENGHADVTRIVLVPLKRPGELVGAEQQNPVVVYDLNHQPKSTLSLLRQDVGKVPARLELPSGGSQS